MSVEAVRHEVAQLALDRHLVSERNLIFDDGVHGRMQCGVRELDACAPMIVLDEVDSFLLVERKPCFGMGCLEWIVLLHGGAAR
jgi:hypothetical protein